MPEIQELDARKIVRAKLLAARIGRVGELLVDDTSLYLDCLGGLPGPLIKWFLKSLGGAGLYQVAESLGEFGAQARTWLGHVDEAGEMRFFEGAIPGRIVAPRGDRGFGWDAIFQPEGCQTTFAEMDDAEKNAISMRRLAIEAYLITTGGRRP